MIPYFFWEIPLQLLDALAPVRLALLRDQLDVEETALSWAVVLSGCHAAYDAWRHVGYKILLRLFW